jgi:hypothetical protein
MQSICTYKSVCGRQEAIQCRQWDVPNNYNTAQLVVSCYNSQCNQLFNEITLMHVVLSVIGLLLPHSRWSTNYSNLLPVLLLQQKPKTNKQIQMSRCCGWVLSLGVCAVCFLLCGAPAGDESSHRYEKPSCSPPLKFLLLCSLYYTIFIIKTVNLHRSIAISVSYLRIYSILSRSCCSLGWIAVKSLQCVTNFKIELCQVVLKIIN